MIRETLEKYVNSAGATIVFSRLQFQQQLSQPLRVGFQRVTGANFSVDHLLGANAAVDNEIITVRYDLINDSIVTTNQQVRDLRTVMRTSKTGKIWRIRDNSIREWAFARPTVVGDIRTVQTAKLGVALNFERFSDWFGAANDGLEATITTTPKTFTIINNGELAVELVIFRFRANGASGFTHSKLENLTNGLEFSTIRDAASANDEIRVDCGKRSVELSTDDGVSYANDFDAFSIGALQVSFMRLEPGANSMRYTDNGTPALDIEWAFNQVFP